MSGPPPRLGSDAVDGADCAVVDIQRRLLVIADIGGYTRYMLATRISLAHAQVAVTGLLEAVIDGAKALELAKLEGDAAFFHGPVGADLAVEIGDIQRRFVAKKQQLIAERMCDCAGCSQLEALTLKFVAHSGEVAVHRVKHNEELSGVDVILVHRLLKNSVPIKEYLLMTDPVLEALPPKHTEGAQSLEEDLEGIGATAVHYVRADAFADVMPPPAESKGVKKLWKKIGMELRSLPYWLGVKKVSIANDDDANTAPR